MSKKDLTHLQQNFLNNLMKGMSQKDAYIQAGYKAKGKAAENHASRLVANGRFKPLYERAKQKAAYKAEVSQVRILTEEKCLAYFDPAELFNKSWTLIHPKELPEHVRRAILGLEAIELAKKNGEPQRYKFKYRFADKGKSLERLGRVEGIYNDKVTLGIDIELLGILSQAIKQVFPPAWAIKFEAAFIDLLQQGGTKYLTNASAK